MEIDVSLCLKVERPCISKTSFCEDLPLPQCQIQRPVSHLELFWSMLNFISCSLGTHLYQILFQRLPRFLSGLNSLHTYECREDYVYPYGYMCFISRVAAIKMLKDYLSSLIFLFPSWPNYQVINSL